MSLVQVMCVVAQKIFIIPILVSLYLSSRRVKEIQGLGASKRPLIEMKVLKIRICFRVLFLAIEHVLTDLPIWPICKLASQSANLRFAN